MRYQFYSRTNQVFLDAAVIGGSFYLAYEIRYAGQVPAYQVFQFWSLVVPIIVGRLVTNHLFGLNKIQWRHVSFRDVFSLGKAYSAFSLVLLVARYALPDRLRIGSIPVGVIATEFLMSLLGALCIRMLRRFQYEHQLRRAESKNAKRVRRLLLIGAGMMGTKAARELSGDPSVQVVGFLDDDPQKVGCIIAGAKVLGPTSILQEVIRTESVDSVLVCIAPAARGSFNRLVALLDGLPVASKFAPTMTEILDSQDGLHLSIGQSHAVPANGFAVSGTQQKSQIPWETRQIKNKCVLITGGAGFIGSTLAERLAKDNQILLVDRFFQNQPVSFTSLRHHPNVRMIEADILDGPSIGDYAKEANVVIHAAAIVGVGRVCSYPRETLETNFIGTSRILKTLEKNSRLERFLYFSTSEVFGVNSFRVHEDTPAAVGSATQARWSYAIAKLAGEHLVKAYHRQSAMPVVTVRPFNVFGPRRLGSHAILGFIVNALTGTPIEIHGDGSQIRSWCYIEDFCDAIMEMLTRPGAVGEDFNIGNPQNTVTVLQLAQEVLNVTESSVPIHFVKSPFPDIEIRVPSLEKAREILDYQPSYDLRRGLQLTMEWYRENLNYFESKMARALAASQGR